MDYKLYCTKHGHAFGKDMLIFRCTRCGSILEVKYDYRTLRLPKDFKKIRISQGKYAPLFPAWNSDVSIGEGGTKLVNTDLDALERNGTKLFLKIETANPTRSFKDRGSSVEISRVLELGCKDVVCASTGNMGLSVATYARRNGISCTVFISSNGNKEKMGLIEKAGATLIKVDGDFNKATILAEKYAHENGAFVCGDYHYRKEGQKGVAYEIVEQLGYNVPDYLFVQVGNATLIAAIYKALVEFSSIGLIAGLPKLIAVQSSQCAPLVKAFESNAQIKHVAPKTRADAIAVGYPTFGEEGLIALEKTHGSAIGISDRTIESYRSMLDDKVGIRAELGGASGFAGFMEAYKKNKGMFKNRSVVAIVTGNNEGGSGR